MRLTLRTRYKSLRALDPTDLPKFVMLTGVNGAGKTHLLQAILEGAVSTDVAPNHKTDVRYFDWTSLMPNDAGQMSTSALYASRDQILQHVANARKQTEPRLDALLAGFPSASPERDPWELGRLSATELERLVGDRGKAQALFAQLQSVVQQASQQIMSQLGGNPQFQTLLREVSQPHNGLVALVDFNDFHGKHFVWGEVDLFQQSFAQLFLAYFELRKINRLNRMERDDGRTPAEMPLDEAAFQAMHGEPPWDFVNKTLRNAKLNFEVDHPTSWTTTNYLPKLTKSSSGACIPFSSLSSGEKILMSFAICLYYSTDRRQLIRRPKLLLLDEVDAPLHPSMCRRLVETVVDTLVNGEGIPVIMTTHSPSTVAIAPEDSIYVMEPEIPGLRKSSKTQALAVLTAGIPTLSITFDGRRQVFVESDTDAELYGLLYAGIRPSLESERSLVFIGAGRRPATGTEQSAGCAQVKSVVERLAKGGNVSVFGLVDWDRVNEPTGRVHVLGHGERYSIENCLLDPLLLGAVAFREDNSVGARIGLATGESFFHLPGLGTERLQSLVDSVQRLVLKLPTESDLGSLLPVRYLGGFDLKIAERYLWMNGHDLEKAAKEAFPHLKAFHNSGELLRRIVVSLLSDIPKFLPEVVRAELASLLNADPSD